MAGGLHFYWMGISLSTGEGILFLLEGDLYFYWRGNCISTGGGFVFLLVMNFVCLLEGNLYFYWKGILYFYWRGICISPPGQIKQVRLMKDEGGRLRGYGYADFEDRDSLVSVTMLTAGDADDPSPDRCADDVRPGRE